MPTIQTRVFRSGNSDAVRLPREVSFGEGVELIVVRAGDVLTLYPARLSLAAMVERLGALPAPPEIERRDDEALPDRTGL